MWTSLKLVSYGRSKVVGSQEVKKKLLMIIKNNTKKRLTFAPNRKLKNINILMESTSQVYDLRLFGQSQWTKVS